VGNLETNGGEIMAFRGVLPEVPGFGNIVARGLGEGMSHGINQAIPLLLQGIEHKRGAEYFAKLRGEHPGERTYELLAEAAQAPTSLQEKFLQAFTGQQPFYAAQQERLNKDSTLRRYNSRIREIDEELKFGTNFAQKEQLRELKQLLQAERDKLLDFKALKPPSDNEDADTQEEEEVKVKKVKFDSNNPKHRAVRDKVLKQTKGDRKKAGEILSRHFD
jgi:hypothetical protein